MNGTGQSLLPLMATVALVGAIPLLVVVATSFTKVSVVLLILRNAIGIQQTPPNMVIYAIAMVLSFNIMNPVLQKSLAQVGAQEFSFRNIADLQANAEVASAPIKKFLADHSTPASREFFLRNTPKAGAQGPAPADLAVLVPAFLLDELTRAFEIGLMLYLPFLAIDFLVSAVLIAMGMQMMSPPLISTPLKILLFVVVSGWTRLFENLVLSYQAAP